MGRRSSDSAKVIVASLDTVCRIAVDLCPTDIFLVGRDQGKKQRHNRVTSILPSVCNLSKRRCKESTGTEAPTQRMRCLIYASYVSGASPNCISSLT